MKFVSGDAVTFLAADLQDDPKTIFKMVKKWIEGNELTISQDLQGKILFSPRYYQIYIIY